MSPSGKFLGGMTRPGPDLITILEPTATPTSFFPLDAFDVDSLIDPFDTAFVAFAVFDVEDNDENVLGVEGTMDRGMSAVSRPTTELRSTHFTSPKYVSAGSGTV